MVSQVIKRIKLRPQSFFLERGVEVPGFVWRESPFLFKPQPFALSDERLQQKIFDESVQLNSLYNFESNPHAPIVYGVASEPNDSRALYFAAYLIQVMLEYGHTPQRIKWERIYSDFKNDLLYSEANLSMLVLSNLTPNSTANKLEKTRDLLDAYSNIPRIVVVSGEDPITFFSRKLFYKVNAVFHYSSTLVKRKVEVL